MVRRRMRHRDPLAILAAGSETLDRLPARHRPMSYDSLRTAPAFGMTVGGLASLFVTHDYLDTPMYIGPGSAGRDPFTPALAKGLAYLEAGDNSVGLIDDEVYYLGYNLFGLERVALASGFKYFGKHEWYRELTSRVLPLQWPN